MSIKRTKLDREEAWRWAVNHGLPGVPLDRSRLEVELPDQNESCALIAKNGRFVLVHRRGITLADGGHFVDRQGKVDRVFLRFPGTLYPFEGEHSANRYMADGRHVRRLGTREDDGQADLVQIARAQQIARYSHAKASLPSQAEYRAKEAAVEAIIDLCLRVDPDLCCKGSEVIAALRGETIDAALQRACMVYQERIRIEEPDSTMKIVANEADERRLAEQIRLTKQFGAEETWCAIIGSVLFCVCLLLAILLPGAYIILVCLGFILVLAISMAALMLAAGQARKRLTVLKAQISVDFEYESGGA